jgi:hypothetical protein
MSTGFRIFLLILVSFGAIYAYRFRSREIDHWLRGQSPDARGPEADDGLVSPVERVLEPDVSLARLVGSPLFRAARPLKPDGPQRRLSRDLDSFAADLPEESRSEAADLAAFGEAPEPAAGEESLADPAVPPPAPAPAPDAAETTRPPLESYTEITYKVEAGDNLWRIAAKYLGSGSRFGEIREMNPDVFRGKSTGALAAGTILKIRIPRREESFKVSEPDADTTVEEKSAPASEEPRRKAPRPVVKQGGKAQRVVGR